MCVSVSSLYRQYIDSLIMIDHNFIAFNQERKFNLEETQGLHERKFNLEAKQSLQERKFYLEAKQGLQERKFNLEEKQSLQGLQERKFYLKEKRGLAILVTCDYQDTLPQTKRDAEEMNKMFEQFEYDVHSLINEEATLSNIKDLVEQVTKYLDTYNGADENHDGSKKAIIFAFSGHGTHENQIKSNDWKPLRLHDIVKPLVNPKLALAHPIPKLFFIDACRGRIQEDMTGAIEGNYCIEFATLQNHDAGALRRESEWMPVLADRLMSDDDTYQNVIAKVRSQVATEGQQPQAITNFTTGMFKLYHYTEGEKYGSNVCVCPCASSHRCVSEPLSKGVRVPSRRFFYKEWSKLGLMKIEEGYTCQHSFYANKQ